MNKPKISLVVAVVDNEIPLLKDCLNSAIGFADELVVFGLGIDESQLNLPMNFRFHKHLKVKYIELARNSMIQSAKGDWVLLLDPDERITPGLGRTLKLITKNDTESAANIPRKNIFFGHWIAHSNWWPDKQVRFFKKDKVKWSEEIHSYPEVDGAIFDVPSKPELAIEHYGYRSVSEFIERQKRYARVLAKDRLRAGTSPTYLNLIWWPTRQFLVRFVKNQGYLDGFYGLLLTGLMMKFEVDVWLNMHK